MNEGRQGREERAVHVVCSSKSPRPWAGKKIQGDRAQLLLHQLHQASSKTALLSQTPPWAMPWPLGGCICGVSSGISLYWALGLFCPLLGKWPRSSLEGCPGPFLNLHLLLGRRGNKGTVGKALPRATERLCESYLLSLQLFLLSRDLHKLTTTLPEILVPSTFTSHPCTK